jgi:RHS repeat-associated protein
VTHAGGASTVTVNQRVNGGQWNLLGTWSFDSGTDYKVELSDAVAAGKVAADAIYIAPAGAPSSDAFTWTPAIPGSGTYTVYARWPAASANTGAAQYTVTHGGGTANVTLNQKQNGGSWVPLGSWSFAPGAGHTVTLAAAADGTTIADAMLFVAAGAQPANLLYVHPDHLGSPQKLTDAGQATVWDGVFDPFGEEVAIAGLAAMPLRFPGQYADEETGYSYNYYRDYDPTLGRYIQSDPIGLDGGINTYAYVESDPISGSDIFGLAKKPKPGKDPKAKRNTGRCSSAIHSLLQLRVNLACKFSGPRRCDESQDCSTLTKNLLTNLECHNARAAINAMCFGGGDQGHRQAQAQAWSAVERCRRIIARKCSLFSCILPTPDNRPSIDVPT